MLARMAGRDPPPFFMGGFAEDALLAGTVTHPHEAFDSLLPRAERELQEKSSNPRRKPAPKSIAA